MLKTAIILALLACATMAQDRVVRYRKEAEELARSEDYVGAARIYAKALALAHKRDHVLVEQELAFSMAKSFKRMWKWKAGPDGAGSGGLRKVLYTLMGPLDAERSAAYISAHLLAQELICRATWTGDTKYVKAAAGVIADHAGESDVGKCAAVMNTYAKGMLAVAAKRDGDAAGSLQRALTDMAAEGWTDLAMFCGTELAAVYLRMGKQGPAGKAIQTVASTYPDDGDRAFIVLWQDLVKVRLKGAPKGVMAAYRKALAHHKKRGSVPAPDAEGREGAHGGRNATSLLGRKLPHFSSRRPLATIERESGGWKCRQRFDRRWKKTQPFLESVRYNSNQGCHLRYWGRACGLAILDPTGLESEPMQSIWPSPFTQLYHLARGETWGVTKRGKVSVE